MSATWDEPLEPHFSGLATGWPVRPGVLAGSGRDVRTSLRGLQVQALLPRNRECALTPRKGGRRARPRARVPAAVSLLPSAVGVASRRLPGDRPPPPWRVRAPVMLGPRPPPLPRRARVRGPFRAGSARAALPGGRAQRCPAGVCTRVPCAPRALSCTLPMVLHTRPRYARAWPQAALGLSCSVAEAGLPRRTPSSWLLRLSGQLRGALWTT